MRVSQKVNYHGRRIRGGNRLVVLIRRSTFLVNVVPSIKEAGRSVLDSSNTGALVRTAIRPVMTLEYIFVFTD